MHIFSKAFDDIFHNTKIKEYPDGNFKITCADKKVFKESGWESSSAKEHMPKPKDMTNETRSDSLHRTIEQIHDIIRCNNFSFFVTLTFDPEKVNSKSPKETYKIMRVTLSNLVQRNDVSYILIPELHKSGAIHLHGFMKGNLALKDSGTVIARGCSKPIKIETAKRYRIPLDECKTVYNLPQWSWGFTTAVIIPAEEYISTSKYVTKYVTKDVQKIFGSAYLSGGSGLIRKAPYILADLDYNELVADYECYCAPTDTNYKYFDSTKQIHKETT